MGELDRGGLVGELFFSCVLTVCADLVDLTDCDFFGAAAFTGDG
jgi:hypothetical protein